MLFLYSKERKMRYKRGTIESEDEISKIFERYSVAKETEFVKNFFEMEEINAILEECGFETLSEDDVSFPFDYR
jgi:hypothetical protein